jgi:2-iminobutanoate/2-iminopropanoate deaminase
MIPEVVDSADLPRARGAESLAVRAKGLVFVSGIESRLGVPHALGQGEAVLERLGSCGSRIAKIKVSGGDGVGRAANELRRAFPSRPVPAMAWVGAALPGNEARVSVELIAGAADVPIELAGPTLDRTGVSHVGGGTRLGDLVFTDCVCSSDSELPGDLGRQSESIFASLADTLASAGHSFADVTKVNGTVAAFHGLQAYNRVYKRHLHEPYTARATIQGGLTQGALLGVELIASTGSPRLTLESEIPGPWHEPRRAKQRDTLYLAALHPLKGPHSHAVRAGSLIFMAGACPYNAQDQLIAPGDVAGQTRGTLENIRLMLRALGSELDDIVKTNVTLANVVDFVEFDAAYASYFHPPYPARQTVGAGLAQPGMLVEIEAVAVVGAAREGIALVGRG